ncbi:hypothetical protein AB4851_04515 [Burkholderia sp. 22PA0099]|uniref:hypothetical protein n=1 Tax=Burkholderia sp. 22PA0099 TaxID=3237372 RepID=UPI0039C13A47
MVPFSAKPSENSDIIAKHPKLYISDSEIKENYSYVSDGVNKKHKPEKIFYAERYGGDGISFHGGGARCGYDGEIQIKGIGVNPLTSPSADPHHRNGRCSLKSALSEFAWSKGLEKVLPFGTVCCLAVLAVNFHSANSRLTLKSNDRALILREPALRLAHFDRATYFRPSHDRDAHRFSDVRRVEQMINLLPELLPRQESVSIDEWKTLDSREKLESGLQEFARRACIQGAYAGANLLLHNSSPSNIALDARWLDLGSTVSLHPDKGYSEENFDIAWSALQWQMSPIYRGILGVCIQADKYLFRGEKISGGIFERTMISSQNIFSIELTRYMLAFAGLPMFLADVMCGFDVCQEWAKGVSKHMRDSLGSHVINRGYIKSRGDSSGSQCLNLFHYTFAREFNEPWVRNGNIGRHVVGRLSSLFSQILAITTERAGEMGVSKEALRIAISINAILRAGNKGRLDFDSLSEFFSKLIDDCEENYKKSIEFIRDGVDKKGAEIEKKFRLDIVSMSSLIVEQDDGVVELRWRENILIKKIDGNIVCCFDILSDAAVNIGKLMGKFGFLSNEI